jgi:hypothetical protein
VPALRQTIHLPYRPKLWSHFSPRCSCALATARIFKRRLGLAPGCRLNRPLHQPRPINRLGENKLSRFKCTPRAGWERQHGRSFRRPADHNRYVVSPRLESSLDLALQSGRRPRPYRCRIDLCRPRGVGTCGFCTTTPRWRANDVAVFTVAALNSSNDGHRSDQFYDYLSSTPQVR